MKKFWLSFFVIGTFTLYAAYFGNNGSLSYVAAPVTEVKNKTVKNNKNTTTQTVTNTSAPRVPNSSDDDNTSGDDYYGYQSNSVTVPKIITTTTTVKTVVNTVPKTVPVPVSQPVSKPKGLYTDGTYVGSNEYAYSGYIRATAVITNGRLSNIQYPSTEAGPRRSQQIYDYAMPQLKSEAISAQSANINGVSGATYTSDAFIQSLAYALTQAKQ